MVTVIHLSDIYRMVWYSCETDPLPTVSLRSTRILTVPIQQHYYHQPQNQWDSSEYIHYVCYEYGPYSLEYNTS